MPLTHNTAYLTQARSRYPAQYAGKPRFDAIVQAFSAEAQQLEDAMWAVYVDRLLQNNAATGDLLDKLGKIVGQPRNGMLDAEYLILITARIVANRSDGRRETLIRLAKLLVPGAVIYVKEFTPGAVYIAPQGAITIDPYVAASFMIAAKAGGVNIVFAWTPAPLSTTLTFGDIYAAGFSAGPPVTNAGVTSAQSPGDIYHAGFSAGPVVTNDGGGTLAEVIQSQGADL
jgi:hypothetical protein